LELLDRANKNIYSYSESKWFRRASVILLSYVVNQPSPFHIAPRDIFPLTAQELMFYNALN
jgi:hypothetical protein